MQYSVCVCGAGTMGSGIAEVAIRSGLSTILYDPLPASIGRAGVQIKKNLQHSVDKNKITGEEMDQMLARLTITGDWQLCLADIVIEAIVEAPEPKAALINQLAAINTPETIFASNTSSLSITAIAEKTICQERVIGIHFFNPAPLMKLVEVVSTPHNTPALTDQVIGFVKKIGKIPVRCEDAPGFIVNHVARPYYLEALRILALGAASLETIDMIMEASGFRMGPFRLMDLIGNDINYAVSCSVYEGLNKPERLKPSPTQEEKVKTGALGKKTGQGYYNYP